MADRRYRDNQDLRYIFRFERFKTWRVQYVRGLPSPIQVYFADNAYGSTENALRAAQQFRDELVAKHGHAPGTSSRRNLRHLDKPEEQVGIMLFEDARPGRQPVYAWRAHYMAGDKVIRRSWSIRKYGYVEAYRRASAFRHERTGQPQGDCPPIPQMLVTWAKKYRLAL